MTYNNNSNHDSQPNTTPSASANTSINNLANVWQSRNGLIRHKDEIFDIDNSNQSEKMTKNIKRLCDIGYLVIYRQNYCMDNFLYCFRSQDEALKVLQNKDLFPNEQPQLFAIDGYLTLAENAHRFCAYVQSDIYIQHFQHLKCLQLDSEQQYRPLPLAKTATTLTTPPNNSNSITVMLPPTSSNSDLNFQTTPDSLSNSFSASPSSSTYITVPLALNNNLHPQNNSTSSSSSSNGDMHCNSFSSRSPSALTLNQPIHKDQQERLVAKLNEIISCKFNIDSGLLMGHAFCFYDQYVCDDIYDDPMTKSQHIMFYVSPNSDSNLDPAYGIRGGDSAAQFLLQTLQTNDRLKCFKLIITKEDIANTSYPSRIQLFFRSNNCSVSLQIPNEAIDSIINLTPQEIDALKKQFSAQITSASNYPELSQNPASTWSNNFNLQSSNSSSVTSTSSTSKTKPQKEDRCNVM